MERKRGHMDIALLEKALDEIADYSLAKIIAFHLMGEPLIYPHIFEAIEMAIARRLKLHLTTNGSTFHIRPEHIEKLVSSGIPKVTISLQTPDPELFPVEIEQSVESLLPGAKREAEKVLHYIQDGTVKVLNEKHEIGYHFVCLDSRPKEEI